MREKRVSLAPKTPFPCPFKRLPRRLSRPVRPMQNKEKLKNSFWFGLIYLSYVKVKIACIAVCAPCAGEQGVVFFPNVFQRFPRLELHIPFILAAGYFSATMLFTVVIFERIFFKSLIPSVIC